MMSLEYMRSYAAQKATLAREEKTKPYVALYDSDEGVFGCPFLGSYVPKDWRLIRKLFVDKSGFGASDEPALTADKFLKEVKQDYGYAIYQEGQFQVYIAEYSRKRED